MNKIVRFDRSDIAVFRIAQEVGYALQEDLAQGDDWTALLIDSEKVATAYIASREPALLCGQPWAEECFRQINPGIEINWATKEGGWVEPLTHFCTLRGNVRALLTAERTALNFLQLLSATATVTAQYVRAIQGTRAQIFDTRKTIPHLRYAQKYAVRIGGGHNQRLGLFDGILIKENHILAAGSISQALKQAQRFAAADMAIQIEVENLAQLKEALGCGATSILLDNMELNHIASAVKMAQGKALLEVSGGVDLDIVRAIAQTGVDRISIGKLTKNIQAIDLSMRLISVT